MLIGLGHDLQALEELQPLEGLWEPGAFFTEAEAARFEWSPSPVESLAAGFSSKEALFKALPPIEGWYWTDAELHHDERHAPHFRFHGVLREFMERQGWYAKLSISHSGGFVSTVVIVSTLKGP
ncbi:holo-ACP synthase [Hyalangium rubrum]|uniref:4'-phosphopantetheinyl transferase superfamily protein n=1 Tax=Hyalangium rubrum TaxID=3103134 RepID=A0ABU5H1C0_9BACT|nr:4'-phosphopantetheinyl transferase superfamily protein [Hyalangium sp. s54d21]MDY7227238.1 4'-phosphopantetheinyl transferase superfamily protein [Hyalangium sp. s54d21]